MRQPASQRPRATCRRSTQVNLKGAGQGAKGNVRAQGPTSLGEQWHVQPETPTDPPRVGLSLLACRALDTRHKATKKSVIHACKGSDQFVCNGSVANRKTVENYKPNTNKRSYHSECACNSFYILLAGTDRPHHNHRWLMSLPDNYSQWAQSIAGEKNITCLLTGCERVCTSALQWILFYVYISLCLTWYIIVQLDAVL